ncbi:MAG: helix-turn-helix domain-containing protein [Planctomycetota bacterium]
MNRYAPGDRGVSRYTAPALDKGLDILETLADKPDGLNLKGLADELGRRPNEIFRMVVRLQERGYIRRGDDDVYHLSARLLALAHRHTPTKRLIEAALPVMNALAARIDQGCHLAQLHPPDLVVVAEAAGTNPLGLMVRTGSSHEPLQTTSGRLLLAIRNDASIPASERRKLSRSRVVKRPSSIARGVTDLAAPIYDYTGQAVAALSVPLLRPRKETGLPERILRELEAAARDLSDALGGSASNS